MHMVFVLLVYLNIYDDLEAFGEARSTPKLPLQSSNFWYARSPKRGGQGDCGTRSRRKVFYWLAPQQRTVTVEPAQKP